MGIARLAGSTGAWTGNNGFRLMPTDAFATRPASAVLALAAGEHLASFVYQWEHPDDGPQDGHLVFGVGADADSLVGLWGDSWHQQPAPLSMTGEVGDDSFLLAAEYAPGWTWRIEIVAGSPGLRMRMVNIVPADQATADMSADPYDVMQMELRRL